MLIAQPTQLGVGGTLGREDSNLNSPESKPGGLPIRLHPIDALGKAVDAIHLVHRGDKRIRTSDTRIRSPVLYPLSYVPGLARKVLLTSRLAIRDKSCGRRK